MLAVDALMPERIIVAMGGGSLLPPYESTRDEFILSLARRPTPRVAFVATASGDSDGYTAAFFRSVGSLDCVATDLTLFERREADLRRFVLGLDVLYVGGGNTLSLLAVWRAHGLDEILRDAWHGGVVLCGVSAGMNCWFEQSITDSYEIGIARVLNDGLGFLPGSSCPHYDAEEARRPAYQQAVARGDIAPGYAADHAAALVFSGTELREVVSRAPSACAYRVEPAPGGDYTEQVLPARLLG